jgi:hypothetical protein
MSTMRKDELQREFQEKARSVPQADWVRDMIDHYRRTGTYRAKDLRRLLGDPNRSVEVGPNTSVASFFSTEVRR